MKRVALVSPIPEFGLIVQDDELKVHTTVDPFTGSSVTYRDPIALEYIDACVRQNGYECNIFTETEMKIDKIIRKKMNDRELSQEDVEKIKEAKAKELIENLASYGANTVGISVHSAVVYPDTVSIARKLKATKPDSYIILGGYHPTGEIMEYAKGNIGTTLLHRKDIDFVVCGEGEDAFVKLANALQEGRDLNDIPGLAFKDGDTIVVNPRGQRVDFKSLPWPTRYKEILENSRCAPLAYPSPNEQNAAAQISGSRGCVYGCDFCSSMTIWPVSKEMGHHRGDPSISYRDVKDIVAEIKYLRDKFNVNFLTFTDLTLNSSKRFVGNLTDEMIAEGVGKRPDGKGDIGWFAYATVERTVSHPETIEMLADAGCSRIGIGVETLHREIAKEHELTNKHELDSRIDVRIEKSKRALEIVDSQGILNRTYLIVGWPNETPEMFDETRDILLSGDLPTDQLRIAFIVPFMGTPLFGKYKDRLLYKIEKDGTTTWDWTKFTGDHPVVENDYMTPKEMKQKVKGTLTDFYRSDMYKEHIRKKTREFPHLKSSFKYWEKYMHSRGILPTSHKLVD